LKVTDDVRSTINLTTKVYSFHGDPGRSRVRQVVVFPPCRPTCMMHQGGQRPNGIQGRPSMADHHVHVHGEDQTIAAVVALPWRHPVVVEEDRAVDMAAG